MKMKKIIPLLFTCLALSSCGEEKYIGRYSFQMGKDDGTHFGAAVVLSNEDHVDEEGKPTGYGKKFSLTVAISTFGPDGLTVPGAYTIGEATDKETYLVNLYFDGLSDLIAALVEGVEIETAYTYLQKVLTTEVDDKSFYITIPVSFDDLYLQLYWYGLDICNTDPEASRLVEAHPLLSHPTKAQIDKLNENDAFSKTHKNKDDDPLPFRDYHPIRVGLTRDDKK